MVLRKFLDSSKILIFLILIIFSGILLSINNDSKINIPVYAQISSCPIYASQPVLRGNTSSGNIPILCMDINGNLFLTSGNFYSIRIASGFNGSDCGAKINAADTDLGTKTGQIWVDQNCGTSWTTPINISANHVLNFIQGGTYLVGGMITLNAPSPAIIGSPVALSSSNAAFGQVVLKESNGANLPAVVKCIGTAALGGCVVRDIVIDGNKTNQTCPSPPCYGLWNFKNPRPNFLNVSVQNAFSSGIMIESSAPPANESGSTDIINSMSLNNNGSALKVLNSADIKITHSEFENSNIGGEFIDSPTPRISNSDFGGNTLNGIKSTCTSTAFNSSGMIVTGGQFGTNGNADDLFIDAWTGTAQCSSGTGNQITGAMFFSSGTRTAATFDGIKIQNSQWNSVTGNTLRGPVSFKTAVEFLSPNTPEGRDTFTGNVLENWATSACTLAITTTSINNSTCTSQLPQGSLNTNMVGSTLAPAFSIGAVGLTTGWGTSTVTAASGFAQHFRFTISITGVPAANPTITITTPTSLLGSTVLCSLSDIGGTAAFFTFQQTTQSATAPVFTMNGTPVAATTLIVEGICGP